ncbi:hypothetical protein R3D73_005454 [Serratia marcescens]|nr:hypothetical protein [Serratia marcescens]ELQ9442527.1 hypothetical protein [Serratia marcescens]ELT5563288.1 hypothetical protein [Serratia marcescens]
MTSTSDTPASRLKRFSAAERCPRKLTLRLPPGLVTQLEDAAQKAGLSPEQWLVAAAFEKLRRELYRKPQKPRRRSRPGGSSAKSTPDFFLKMLRRRQTAKGR